MTVAITGASGFLGRHLAAHLTASGRDVLAFTRDARRIPAAPGVRVVETDYAALPLAGVVTLVHLAAERNRAASRPSRVNPELTLRVARAAAGQGVRRFVHVSSALVLGPSTVPLDAAAPLRDSTDPYVRSRIEALHAAEAVRGLPVVTLLSAIVYGPDFPEARNRITGHMRRLLARPVRPGVAGGGAPRNLVYADDVVRAIVAMEDQAPGVRRLVAGEDVTQEDFERAVCAAAGRRLPLRLAVPPPLLAAGARAADLVTRGEQTWSHRLATLLSPWCFQSDFPPTPLVAGIAATVRSL